MQQSIQALLVKYYMIFARQRLDIGINTDFKIKLTPKHYDPVYAQSLTTPTNLKDVQLVELPLMQEYGLVTTLPSANTLAQYLRSENPIANNGY